MLEYSIRSHRLGLWHGWLAIGVAVFTLVMAVGCGHKPTGQTSLSERRIAIWRKHNKLESVEFYAKKLHDKDFRWDGPCSCEYCIPVLHAARALAYIGDPAVPALLQASKDESIDSVSIYYALTEIGLPVDEYWKDGSRADPKPLEKWWEENRVRTAPERSRYREDIGLPPIPGV